MSSGRVGSSPTTGTSASVIIGFEYSVRTLAFLCGVAERHSFASFYVDVEVRDILPIGNLKSSDAVIMHHYFLCNDPVDTLRVIDFDVVDQFRHHSPRQFLCVGVTPDYFKKSVGCAQPGICKSQALFSVIWKGDFSVLRKGVFPDFGRDYFL